MDRRVSCSLHWRRRGVAAFTLIEVVVSLGLLCVVMGAFAIALNSSSDALMVGCAKGIVTSELGQALRTVETDLRETSGGSIAKTEAGLPAGQCALVFPSARDSSGVFHVDSTGRPAWQAVVIYCPYVTSSGISQLRRYTYDASPGDFPFWFEGAQPITESQILLGRMGGGTVTIDRVNGNPARPAGQKYRVLCPGLTRFEMAAGNPAAVTLGTGCSTRRQMIVAEEETAYVAQRN